MPYKDPKVQREYQRVWISDRRTLWFSDKCCRKCSSKEALELDHEDPAQKWKHRIWSYSWTRIMKEVAKCQVLCHDCHMEKTIEDQRITEHGSETAYVHAHCRCEECSRNKNIFPSELREYMANAGA